MNQKRIIAGIIDFMILGLIQAILMGLFLIIPLMNGTISNDSVDVLLRQLCITYTSICFFIIRDILGKRSIGKIIMKLKIVDKITGNDANFLKRFLRNITWIIMPVEMIVFLITKERIGDKIAKTNVIETGIQSYIS